MKLHRRRHLWAVARGAIFGVCMLMWVAGVFAQVKGVNFEGREVHPTRILAKLKPEAERKGMPAAAALPGVGRVKEQRFPLLPDLVVLEEEAIIAAPGSAAQAALPVADEVRVANLQARMEVLRASGLYEYVEVDPMVSIDASPTDAAFVDGTLWGLRNTGQAGGVAGADIDAVRAWDLSTGSTDVVVAVIDTGIRYTHRDLAAQMWRNPGESGEGRETNGIDDDGDGYVDNVFGINAILGTGDPMDDNNHGTHCAGTIGAAANNDNPHVGVTWNVRLMALKFLSSSGGGSLSDAIRCIDFAVAKGARIMSNSWSGGGYSQALYDAIAAARARGMLFVAAAGNNTSNNDYVATYPASYALDNVISVAAIDRADQLAYFSNYGATTVDVGAPGVSIYSSTCGSDTEYKSFSGTSMATPHVAGVAALVLARYPNASLEELRARIVNTTTQTAALARITKSGGRVNAYQALSAAVDGTMELIVTSSSGQDIVGGMPVTFSVRVTDLIGVTNATVSARLAGGVDTAFANNGVSPDLVAGDFIYTRRFTPAAVAGPVVLSVTVTAPGKVTVTRDFTFNVLLPPANDAFAAAIALSNANPSIATTATNRAASKQSGEPAHGGSSGGHSVWWTWTAPSAGSVKIHTPGSNFDTTLGVYTGTAVNALQLIIQNDDAVGLTSAVEFEPVVGTVYRIAVDGYGSVVGELNLRVDFTAYVAPSIVADPSGMVVPTGSSASFSAAATATPAPSWQWQRSSDGGFTWYDLTAADYYTGTSSTASLTTTLGLGSAPASANGYRFRARATNAAGTVYTNAAALVVQPTFAAYQATSFLSAELLDASISGPAADPDGDGIVNLLEYAFGSQPKTADTSAAPVVAADASGALTLSYIRRTDTADLIYVVEYSPDLAAGWLSGPGYTQQVAVTVLDATRERVTVRVVAPDPSRGFLRLRVNAP